MFVVPEDIFDVLKPVNLLLEIEPQSISVTIRELGHTRVNWGKRKRDSFNYLYSDKGVCCL